jgi:chemosensory pili system protein ChpC
MSETHEIRSLLAPMTGGAVLVPGSIVAEVIEYQDLDHFETGPDWLIGELKWNGWQVPVVNFAHLAGKTDDQVVSPRSRVLVLKTHSDSASVMHIGIVINGLPRLKTVTLGNLAEQPGERGTGVFSHVLVDDQSAVIPDLDELALAIEKEVYTH